MRAGIKIGMAGVALLVLAASVLVYVPPQSVAVLAWRGGGTPGLIQPGLRARIPLLQRVFLYPAGTVVLEAVVTASSRQGAAVRLPIKVTLRPGDQELLRLHQEGGGRGARGVLLDLVEDRLRSAAAALGTYDLASGAGSRALEAQVRAGLEERFGRAEVTLGSPDPAPEVRASFDPEVIHARRSETGLRVVLIGIDGADWDFIDPLLARGEMPNLARLRREGVWARMRSSVPSLSPLLWTTVATGKSPDRHGINDFLVLDPATGRQVPIDSTFRRTKAIWTLLTEAGLPCDIVAWWATWPAEPISGHLISDRVAYSTFDLSRGGAGAGAVYPPEYAAVVERLRVGDSEIGYPEISRFLHVSEGEFKRARAAATSRREPSESEESINVMVRVLAATETYRRVALDLLDARARDNTPARLFAVYFQGVDEVNHRFAHCAPPRLSLCSDGDYGRYKDAVAAFYRHQDGIVGEIVRKAPDATFVVMSDHGFASGRDRPDDVKPFIEGKPGLWHHLAGIFLASGKGIGRGEIPTVTLYDIAPTLLHLLGLPVPDDMPGKVLQAALRAEFDAAHPVARVPSYESLPGPAASAGRPGAPSGPHEIGGPSPDSGGGTPRGAGPAPDRAAEDEMIEQLRSLGYVGGGGRPAPAAGPQAPAAGSRPEASSGGIPTLLYHANLGTVHMGKKQYDLAEAEYRKALEIDPTSVQAISGLALLYEARGQPERALEMLRALVRQETADPLVTLGMMAELFIRMGRAGDGVSYLEGLEANRRFSGRPEAGLRVALGRLYAAAGRPHDAERSLLRALEIDPSSLTAMEEIFALYDGQNRAADLERPLRAALALDPGSAMHHNWLGLVLRRKRDLRRAEVEFRKCLELAPDLAGPMANLGSLYLDLGRPTDAAAILERALEKDPRSVESRTNLIVALGMERDLAGARRLVEAAEGMALRVPLFYNALAYALHVNGQDDDALAALRQSLDLDPTQAEALRLRAEIEQGRPVAATPYR